jgi:hypothetical protein
MAPFLLSKLYDKFRKRRFFALNKQILIILISIILSISQVTAQTFETENDYGYSKIEEETNKKLDLILDNPDNFEFTLNENNTYTIKPDSASSVEIERILKEDFVNKRIYQRFNITDVDEFQKSLQETYENLRTYGLNGKPYDVDTNRYYPYETHAVDNVRIDDTHIQFQAELHYMYMLTLLDAMKDPSAFAEKITAKIDSNEKMGPFEVDVFSELIQSGDIGFDLTKKTVASCYERLKTHDSEIRAREDMGWDGRLINNRDRYRDAVVNLFTYAYWNVAPKYRVDPVNCMKLIGSASMTYGIDAIDIENKKDWKYFQETQDLMCELNMDFSGDSPHKPWLESIRNEYNTKYKIGDAPELFQDSVYTYNNSNLELPKYELISMRHPSNTYSEFKVIQLLKNFAGRDNETASLAISYLGGIVEKETVDYLMALAHYDPHFGEPRGGCIVDLDYGKDRSTEENQAQAVLSLAGMYASINEARNPVMKKYIENFLQMTSTSCNKTSANIAAIALGVDLPHPNNGIYKTINDVLVGARNLSIMTMMPAKNPIASFKNFGANTTRTTSTVTESAYLFSEGKTLSLIAPTMSPLRASVSIPFVTSNVWQIPTVIINSEKLMNAIFIMTRIIYSGALIKTQTGVFYIDAKNAQILEELEAKAKVKEIEAISKNPIYVEISNGAENIQYVIELKGQAHLEQIMEHLRLLSIVNQGTSFKIWDKNNNFLNPNNPVMPRTTSIPNSVSEIPTTTLNTISKLLQDAGVSPAMEAEVINAFKNGLSFVAPRTAESFMGGNTIATSVEIITAANGTIALNITRTLASGGELIDYYRTFTRTIDGSVLEEAKVLTHPAIAGTKPEVLPLEIPYAMELDAAIANYNNYCKDFTPKL